MSKLNSAIICLAIFSIVIAGGVNKSVAQSEPSIALVGGAVIDGKGGAPIRDAVVLIEGDKIVKVGSQSRIKLPKTARVIDLKGKFILPGLIDMHVHYDGWMGDLFLAHGVTSIKDLGNDAEWMATVSQEVEQEKVRGPRIFYVGNGLDAPPPGRDHHVGVGDPETAKRAVQLLHSRGVAAIKVREKLTPELIRVVVEEAHRLGIPVTGHVARSDARESAKVGIDGLEHASGIVEATADHLSGEKPPGNTIEYYIAELKAHSLIDVSKAKDLVKFLASKKVALIPTMANHWRMASDRRDDFAREDAEYAKNTSLSYVPEHVRQVWATSYFFNVKDADDLAKVKSGYRKTQDLLLAHYKAGGKIIAGSDTLLSVPGLSLQRELLFLVDLGLTPMQAISVATRDNAQFLGKGAELGTIEAGKLADILVLSADPLADIRNIYKVDMVLKGGQVVDTTYQPDYKFPTPKPKLTRPLWIEKLLNSSEKTESRSR